MRLLDLVKVAPALYKAQTAVHLIGPPGCGKSSVIKHTIVGAISQDLGEEVGFCDVLLPTVDAPDIRGFLLPIKNPDGSAGSAFTRSPILPSKEYLAKYKRGIFFLDERNQADQLTSKAVAPVVLDKRFGDEFLPEGWQIWSASNRMSDRAGVIKPMSHLRNRETEIHIDADVLSWAVWAEAEGVHPMIIAWAKQNPTVAFTETVPSNDKPFCTARSLTAAGKFLAQNAKVDSQGRVSMDLPNDPLSQTVVYGSIGEGAGSSLFGFLKVHDQLPTIDEIENDPKSAKCPKELSAGWAAGQMCIHYCQPSNVDKIWVYVERLPREIQVSMAKSLLERSGSILLNSQALTKWVMSNKALINASSK